MQLLDRSTRPCCLTAEGELFFDGVAGMLRQFDSLVAEVRNGGQDPSGQVTIATIYSIGLSYLPDMELSIARAMPTVQYHIHLDHPAKVYRMVEMGVADFGLVSFPDATSAIQTVGWKDEPMIIIASPRHRFAGVGRIKLEDLSQCGLVAYSRTLPIGVEIDKKFRQLGVRPRIVVELDNLDSVKHAVLVNSGVAVVPEANVVDELASGSLKRIACDEFVMTRPLGLIHRRNATLSAPARALARFVLGREYESLLSEIPSTGSTAKPNAVTRDVGIGSDPREAKAL